MAFDFYGMYFTCCLISLINRLQRAALVLTEGFAGAVKPVALLMLGFAPQRGGNCLGFLLHPSPEQACGLSWFGYVVVAAPGRTQRPGCWFDQGQQGVQRYLGRMRASPLLACGVRAGVSRSCQLCGLRQPKEADDVC